MSNPSGPDPEAEHGERGEPDTEAAPALDPQPDHPTEAFAIPGTDPEEAPEQPPGERRFTAPSAMDAGSTQIIDRTPDQPTEIIDVGEPTTQIPAAGPPAPGKAVGPQAIPPRGDVPPPVSPKRRGWGWVIALILVIAALVAVAVLGTVLLTRGGDTTATQEDRVRETIQTFDTAVQRGDLATLRSITCGATAASYNRFDDSQWNEVHARVAAANQYPVVASIDQVVVNGDHAEANVTSFMAYDPATRSTRSFDLQYRDDQWKICQAPVS
ncbi:Rv0361 family membrane protein [Mycolicibacterium palauense]|uniref:Rv0361 family membrane protein n=1 Tax=Mycolicibacterium palauense TaxID=2034511 RepID=UPI000BFEEBAE|nr:DUF4878 domain-containing protein [Mycolicibacterium palauense]